MKKSPENHKAYCHEYYLKNRDSEKTRSMKYYKDHRIQQLQRMKIWHEKNKEQINLKMAIRRQQYKFLVLSHYGGNPPKCECCEEKNIKFLTIDHIKNNGYEHRKLIGEGSLAMYLWIIRNNFPKEFRVLCFNCNLGRGINKGICPHKEE
jgi:hypothetical protein